MTSRVEDQQLHGRPRSDADRDDRRSAFELAPPRRFVLPAVLLLLTEQPGYGYSLEKDLREFRFGHIDRPTVYRTLAQLEADGLVESWSEAPTAGQARRVYGVTPLGERVLRIWMSVIKEERDCLGRVLRRYQATGTIDAVLAEIEGGWAAALGYGWSPVSTTSPAQRRLAPVDTDRRGPTPSTPVPSVDRGEAGGTARRYRLDPERSVVLVEVRSTVGPISFGALGVNGWVEADIADGLIRAGTQPAARVEIAVEGLRSGNSVYDAELLRRIGARRHPLVTLDLQECVASGSENRYRVSGELTFHGVTRPAYGTVNVEVATERRLVITGEQVFDIRDFEVPSPTVLMLRIYPRRTGQPSRRGRPRGGLMGVLVALAVGYVVGARAGSKDLDQVTQALKALTASEEFADVVTAVRSHVGHTARVGGHDRRRPRPGRDGRSGRTCPASVRPRVTDDPADSLRGRFVPFGGPLVGDVLADATQAEHVAGEPTVGWGVGVDAADLVVGANDPILVLEGTSGR